ncbi:hypothetical protein SK128_004201, partial [Halocaridina rubra]
MVFNQICLLSSPVGSETSGVIVILWKLFLVLSLTGRGGATNNGSNSTPCIPCNTSVEVAEEDLPSVGFICPLGFPSALPPLPFTCLIFFPKPHNLTLHLQEFYVRNAS